MLSILSLCLRAIWDSSSTRSDINPDHPVNVRTINRVTSGPRSQSRKIIHIGPCPCPSSIQPSYERLKEAATVSSRARLQHRQKPSFSQCRSELTELTRPSYVSSIAFTV